MKRNEIIFPHQINGKAVTVWVEVDGNHPKDISVTGATDDETGNEVELPDADRKVFEKKAYEAFCCG